MEEKNTTEIYLGTTLNKQNSHGVEGSFIELMGETFYKITHYDEMPPFFMSIVSDSDHWLFISSTGGLTTGRVNSDSALFPYYTDDKVTENAENTGSKTLILATLSGKTYLWEPFSSHLSGIYSIQRNLYKNVYGDKLVFEEINQELGITFQYSWRTSETYGFVKTSRIINNNAGACFIEILDGLQNILPYGTSTYGQVNVSNLLEAYRKNELDLGSKLGIFTLSSTLTDLAEPSESLKATTVWQVGMEGESYLLSANQVDRFRKGKTIVPESEVRGVRGAFMVHNTFSLSASEEKTWYFVAELNQDSAAMASLIKTIKESKEKLAKELEADIHEGSEQLKTITAQADGLQCTNDELSTAHHFANVLFNTMRGGVFTEQYAIAKADLIDFLQQRNQTVLKEQKAFFEGLPEIINLVELLKQASGVESSNLLRLCYEYLPLALSRRHGDPSRPWNKFSINLKNPDGSQKFDFQGNWRDIFQNWEALSYSFPEYTESMIYKFLNATTADGYNPYRITREGIEWEKPDPEDPWANIGYWSDHQIIYLQKLMELSDNFHPGVLQEMLGQKIFTHANVPYRIKDYPSLLNGWYDTIEFDEAGDEQIERKVADWGSDAKLVLDSDGDIYQVNLTEKLMILLLAKFANFVPEGGIWMNTQRPEWNDGNNALVGKGLSIVTLAYIRRYLVFLKDLFNNSQQTEWELSREVKTMLQAMQAVLKDHQTSLAGSFNDQERRLLMDGLGGIASDYRLNFYQSGVSNQFDSLSKSSILEFLDLALQYTEHTLRANQREDKLFHSYNVLVLGEGTATVNELNEMLEGQVAILSSNMLTGQESLEVLNALRNSKIYREDQNSYMLYPDRDLPLFLKKNNIMPEQVQSSQLVAQLVADQDCSLLTKDVNGIYHFNGVFKNEKDVQAALEQLSETEAYQALVEKESSFILELFETIFNHGSFTGRSGTFFGYEGLGCIYWHMVSKLLLAAQETYLRTRENHEDPAVVSALAEKYYDIRNGLGFNKTPDVYGAFPTDPYSHTPGGKGAKQPGMTGQVKEEVLTRFGEIGVVIQKGQLAFQPVLLRQSEFLQEAKSFQYVDVAGKKQTLELPAGSLAYTLCQVPIQYTRSASQAIEVVFANGQVQKTEGNTLDATITQHLFQRDAQVKQVTVYTEALL